VQDNKNTLSPQRRKERRDTVVILLFADPAFSGTGSRKAKGHNAKNNAVIKISTMSEKKI
jgi:hypothetical protein